MLASNSPRGSPRSCWSTHPARHIESRGSPKSGTESMCRSCGNSRIAPTTHSPPAATALARHGTSPADVVRCRQVETLQSASPVGDAAGEERHARRDGDANQDQDQREGGRPPRRSGRQQHASHEQPEAAGEGDVHRQTGEQENEPVQDEREPGPRWSGGRHVQRILPSPQPERPLFDADARQHQGGEAQHGERSGDDRAGHERDADQLTGNRDVVRMAKEAIRSARRCASTAGGTRTRKVQRVPERGDRPVLRAPWRRRTRRRRRRRSRAGAGRAARPRAIGAGTRADRRPASPGRRRRPVRSRRARAARDRGGGAPRLEQHRDEHEAGEQRDRQHQAARRSPA